MRWEPNKVTTISVLSPLQVPGFLRELRETFANFAVQCLRLQHPKHFNREGRKGHRAEVAE
jgi:hypothetical protein